MTVEGCKLALFVGELLEPSLIVAEILRLQAERAQDLMLIPGRVVLGLVLVLERPPPCTVLGTRGLLNAPLSDTPCVT